MILTNNDDYWKQLFCKRRITISEDHYYQSNYNHEWQMIIKYKIMKLIIMATIIMTRKIILNEEMIIIMKFILTANQDNDH